MVRYFAFLLGAAAILAVAWPASPAHAQSRETSLSRILKKAGASEASCKPAPADEVSKAALLGMLQGRPLTISSGEYFFGLKDGKEIKTSGTFAIRWLGSQTSPASAVKGVEINLNTAFGGSDYYFEASVLSTVRNAGKRWYVHNLDSSAKPEEVAKETMYYPAILRSTDAELLINEPASCSVETRAFDCGAYRAWRIVRQAKSGSACPVNPESAYLFDKSGSVLRSWSATGIDGLHSLFLARSEEAIAVPSERLLKALFDVETIRKNNGKWR